MPSVYQLKPAFQRMLRPLVAWLARAGVTANQVTVAACLLSMGLGAWIASTQRGWIALPGFLFVRMALNAIDGMLAKEHGQASRIGAVLNELGDVISDAALTVPFAFVPGINPHWAWVAIFAAALTEFAGLMGQALGERRRYDGPFGKSDRAVVLGAAGAWIGLGWPVNVQALTLGPAIWTVLCAVTVFNRIRRT
jgi:CDP-diacylglycerol--glycerol-3-phosphate 3-phosphatidyltransferase